MLHSHHRRYSQATTDSDDSYTLHNANLNLAHHLYSHTVLQQFEILGPSFSTVYYDGFDRRTLSLNQYIQVLQGKVEEQNEIIAAQDTAISEQSESINAMKRSLNNFTTRK